MFKKYKQLIIGFVLGALLFTITPVNAMVQEYILKKSPDKFVVDGEEVINEKLPMLKHGGYNYISVATFREICDKIGVGFEWIGEKKEIRIDTNAKQPIVEKEPFREREDSMEIISEGILIVDGIEYIAIVNVNRLSRRHDIRSKDGSTKEGILVHYIGEHIRPDNYVTVIDNVPITEIKDSPINDGHPYFIKYSYFQAHILPLLETK